MSNAEPSPRPWKVRYGDTVADATGAKVAACWRPENAALIVEAVNHIGEIRQVAKDTAEAYKRLFRENRILGEELAIRQDHIVIASNAEFRRRAIDKQVALSRKVAEAESERDDLRAERDRLRDMVRRLADNLSRYHLVGERDRALLREARAAIGGEKQ